MKNKDLAINLPSISLLSQEGRYKLKSIFNFTRSRYSTTLRKIRAEESSFPSVDEIANRQDKETVSTRLTHLITTDPVSWHRVDALAAGGMLVPRLPRSRGGRNRREPSPEKMSARRIKYSRSNNLFRGITAIVGLRSIY